MYYNLSLGLKSPGDVIVFRISSFHINHHFLKMIFMVEEAHGFTWGYSIIQAPFAEKAVFSPLNYLDLC